MNSIMLPYAAAIPLLSLVLMMGSATALRAEDEKDRERMVRIQSLIEVLASKNLAPELQGEARFQNRSVVFGKDYDKALQVPVYLAANALLAEDEMAIDLLLAHDDDQRYSCTINSINDDNLTVSQVCRWIASKKLLAYEEDLQFVTKDQFGLYPPNRKEDFRTWWNKNRHRGLVALQLEGIDTTIKFMTEADAATAVPYHPQASPLPSEEFNRLREQNLKTLRATRQYIASTGKVYCATTLDGPHRILFGLPWSRRRFNL